MQRVPPCVRDNAACPSSAFGTTSPVYTSVKVCIEWPGVKGDLPSKKYIRRATPSPGPISMEWLRTRAFESPQWVAGLARKGTWTYIDQDGDNVAIETDAELERAAFTQRKAGDPNGDTLRLELWSGAAALGPRHVRPLPGALRAFEDPTRPGWRPFVGQWCGTDSAGARCGTEPSASRAWATYGCDGCEEYPIQGTRHHCTVCADFDLCAKCYAAGATSKGHEATHTMTAVAQPAPIPSAQ